MRKISLLLFLSFGSIGISQAEYSTGNALTGDTKLACEAVLCLASPTKPSECMASIRKYFGFSARKWKDVVTKRRNFLNLCPVSNRSDDYLFESIGINPEEQRREINDFKNLLYELPHDCQADSLNGVIESREETYKDYSNYLDRVLAKENLTKSERDRRKRRALSSWGTSGGHMWDSDYNDYDYEIVYRVKPNIPKSCLNFYKHSFAPAAPKHNNDFNWYYKNELKGKLPPPVFK